MHVLFGGLFDTDGWPPRWQCGNWSDQMGWLHILSDIAIFGAYTAIPCVLAFFVLRRRDLPFPRIMWLFVAFIFACGFGHLVEAVIFWHPVYAFSGLVKFVTAVVSWGTVFALIQIVPQVLHFPGLARVNTELRTEVDERRRVEEKLRNSEERLASLLESERAARGEAERANRIKDEFLSTVSHELRTPLNSILGYSQLLLAGGNVVEQQEGLSIIERNAKAQAKLIEDLLDMSRIISGKVRLEAKPVEVCPIVESAVATVQPAADAKGIRIQQILNPNTGPVFGDAARLQQVIWNLLTNAVKFTPKNGRVQITVSRPSSHVEIRVSDTGEGIKPEFLPHVFDRFRQADSGTTRRHGGLGLGLSIVKHLVELHGGTVQAQSDGEGSGSTFVVCLPVQIVHGGSGPFSDPTSSRPHLPSPVSLSGLSILLVDDDADSRELVRRVLSEYDASVQAAGSAAEALASIRVRKPDILISDIGMPDKDGYQLIQEVRSKLAIDAAMLPAIALTALARPEDRKKAILAGYQSHVAKPVDPEELAAVIGSLTRRVRKPTSQ